MIPADDRQALVQAFDPTVEETMSMEDVRLFLIDRITRLLESNIDLLLSALYRIDVYEQKVKHAFQTATPHQLPEVLADLIIERQIQKIRIRQSYSERDPNSSFDQ